MNDFFNSRNLIRLGVSLFVGFIGASILRMPGPLGFLIFLAITFGTYRLFQFSADALLDEANRQKEKAAQNPQNGWGNPVEVEAEIVPEVDSRITGSLAKLITRLEPEDLNPDTIFKPILVNENKAPYFDKKKNQIHITKPLFEEWLKELEAQFNVLIPDSKLNEWAIQTPLSEIETWLNEQPRVPLG